MLGWRRSFVEDKPLQGLKREPTAIRIKTKLSQENKSLRLSQVKKQKVEAT